MDTVYSLSGDVPPLDPALFVAEDSSLQPGATGVIYGAVAIALSLAFIALAIPVATRRAGEDDRMKPEKRLFGYSVLYLFALFAALVADRVVYGQGWLA